jgi:tripartite-type tricarboxylate transporter receptor subunit TctC
LQQEIARIVGDAGFRHRNLIERGLEPVASTPEAFARFIREDRAASELIVKESGLQPQ